MTSFHDMLMTSQLPTNLPNTAPDPQHTFVIVEYDANLQLTHVSSNIGTVTGQPPHQYVGQPLTVLICEPSSEVLREFTQDALQRENQKVLNCCIHLSNERETAAELRLQVIPDTTGGWQQCVGLITFTSEPAEKSVLVQQPFLNTINEIADGIPDVVYVYSLVEDRMLYINAAVETVFGTSPAQILAAALHPNGFMHPDDLLKYNGLIEDINQGDDDRFYEGELRFQHTDGSYVSLNTRIRAFSRGTDGSLTAVIGSLRDMTDHRAQAQREIESQAERERLYFLSQFIRSISHDFRTPLSIINSSAYFLVRKEDMEERRARAELIEKQVERLEQMLDQVALSIHLHIPEWYTFAPVALPTILQEVIAENDNPHQVPVTIDFPADPPLLRGDIVFLKLVLDELYKNALQYTTAENSIRFAMIDNTQTATITVTDTGRGIEPEKLNHIFEYYFRADPARSLAGSRQHTGLGLAIVKKIIDTHSGQLHVESEFGRGTRFTIELPIWQDQVDRAS